MDVLSNTALKEDVIISRKDGSKFKVISISDNKKNAKSPLESVKGIKSDVTIKDIVSAIRESRERV